MKLRLTILIVCAFAVSVLGIGTLPPAMPYPVVVHTNDLLRFDGILWRPVALDTNYFIFLPNGTITLNASNVATLVSPYLTNGVGVGGITFDGGGVASFDGGGNVQFD